MAIMRIGGKSWFGRVASGVSRYVWDKMGARELSDVMAQIPMHGGKFEQPCSIKPESVSPEQLKMEMDSVYMLYLDKLEEVSSQEAHVPYVFLKKDEQPRAMSVSMGIEEMKHDLKYLKMIFLSMMAEKHKLDKTNEESPLLKPTTTPKHNLLANMRMVLGGALLEDIEQIRGVVINGDSIAVSFRLLFDFEKANKLVGFNSGGYVFNRREEQRRNGTTIIHYSNQDNVPLFSITGQGLLFHYSYLAQKKQDAFDFALDAFVELVSRVHQVRPYHGGQIIHFHEYAPILQEMLQEGYKRELLGDKIEILINKIADQSAFSDGTLIITKKSKLKGHAEYRLDPQLLPEHIAYILVKPHQSEIVVGFDSPIDYEEIEKRMARGTLLERTECFLADLKFKKEWKEIEKVRAMFKGSRWSGAVSKFKVMSRYFSDADDNKVMECNKQVLAFSYGQFAAQKGMISGLLNTIYDGKLYYTRTVPDEKIIPAFTREEELLISFVNQLRTFYNVFARVAYEKASIESKTYVNETELEWILARMRESGEESFMGKLIFVLQKIIKYGKDDMPMIIKNNQEMQEIYAKMIALLNLLKKEYKIVQQSKTKINGD